jgi:hypothetical protein
MEGKGEEGRGPIQSFCPRAQLVVWPPLNSGGSIGDLRWRRKYIIS